VTKLSSDQQEQLTQAFCKLGLSLYQAKVYSALSTLGPSGVADIQKLSGVPRTKIYEVLEQLLDMGAAEFQSGRPVFYNAISPSIVVDRMRNSYLAAADDANRLLAEMQQTEKSTTEDLVWAVRGMFAVRRRLALTIASAKERVIMIEQYPPKLMLSVKSIMKSQLQKNVDVRAFCILKPEEHLDICLKSEDFIEFRKITSFADVLAPSDDLTDAFKRMIEAALTKQSCLTIADDKEAFLLIPNFSDPSKNTGLTLRIPGLPMMQRILVERVLSQGTTRVK
jgi:sugar-specific transcriptional regulator TrmB